MWYSKAKTNKRNVTTTLSMYVVYSQPKDHPFHYVCRVSTITAGKVEPRPEPFMITKDISKLRNFLKSKGLIWIPRNKHDDPVILESWL